MGSFAHLHCHSEFSELDGAARVKDYVRKAAEDGQPAIASTDHGNLFALPDYESACEEYGIKFIPGIEAYQARYEQSDRPRSGKRVESEDDSSTGKLYHHLSLFARNQVGYHNLCKISTDAWLEGFYYKSRTSWDKLEQFADGLMGTSSCLGGIVLQELMAGNQVEAEEAVSKFVDILGKDNFFIEIQDHGIPEQHKTNPLLIKLARKFDLKIIATNDCHYLDYKDNVGHDVLLCCQTKAKLSDEKRFKFSSDQHHLKTAQEMRYLFKEIPEACDNTLWLAEQVEPITIINKGSYHLPHFEVPEAFSSENEYLTHLVYEGAKGKYPVLTPEVKSRIDFELATMANANMSGYFLIMWDIVRFANSENIMVGPGRGSACGSIISYCLGITKLDPLKHKLLFERFYNPSRLNMPDIDLDMDTRYREHLINYCSEKYGNDKVAQIVTFSRIKAKNAIRDAARVFGISQREADELSKKVPPPLFGKTAPLSSFLGDKPEPGLEHFWPAGAAIRAEHRANPTTRAVLDSAVALEDLVRSTGVHAAAVVIGDRPLVEHLPLMRKKRGSEQGPVTTQFSMGPVEDLGLVKMDFLGLENLDVISDTVQMIKLKPGFEEFDIDAVSLDDDRVYAVLQQGLSTGVFQLESAPMRSLMRSLKPTSFDDIAALIALYRPGPMGMGMHTEYADRKNGRTKVSYLHPDAEPILKDTYGILLYQEQMLEVAKVFAGFTLAEADTLRKATGKKKMSEMMAQEDKFTEGCLANGYSEKLIKDWWKTIVPFADYSFARSHAYGYGLISYQTCYLKAHFPVEYMAAILNSKKNELSKAGLYLAEARKMDIQILAPDLNMSQVDFVPEGKDIRFGLSAVRNVGEVPAKMIISTREKGKFESYDDARKRIPVKAVNKEIMFALTAAGAMDLFGSRGGLLEVLDSSLAVTRKEQAELEAGAQSIFELIGFDTSTKIPEKTLADKKIRALEREFLGISLTKDPLVEWGDQLQSYNTLEVVEAMGEPPGLAVKVAGIVTKVTPWTTRAGKNMATIEIQDFSGTCEVLLFERVWALTKPQLDQAVLIDGNLSDESDKILARKITILSPNAKTMARSNKGDSVSLSSTNSDSDFFEIYFKIDTVTDGNITKLQKALGEKVFLGKTQVRLNISTGEKLELPIFVDPNKPMLKVRLRRIFGKDAVG